MNKTGDLLSKFLEQAQMNPLPCLHPNWLRQITQLITQLWPMFLSSTPLKTWENLTVFKVFSG